ncbi:hypothetical protein CYMTET_4062 [Cymbomonas tetramitiformis]|uniref:Uncharacterized protein n=1 Tax=Cymbomonas tetramitiformis TaxID=36881 RepID=A0AAE0H203_9CHLO|nr:hypothetical protein CYMTET_4062 [Cymbomonas tetramitiformis]
MLQPHEEDKHFLEHLWEGEREQEPGQDEDPQTEGHVHATPQPHHTEGTAEPVDEDPLWEEMDAIAQQQEREDTQRQAKQQHETSNPSQVGQKP